MGGLPAAPAASLRELSRTLCLGSVGLSAADAQAYRGRSESARKHGHACTRCRVKAEGAQAAHPLLGPARWALELGFCPGQSRGKCGPSTVPERGPPGAVPSLDPRVITQCFNLKYALLSTRTKPQQLTAGGPSDCSELASLYVRTCKWGPVSPPKGSASWPGPPPGSQWRRVKTWPRC